MAAAASSGGAASGGGAGGFESFAPLAGANYVLSIATELAGAKDAAAVAFAGKAADLRALVPKLEAAGVDSLAAALTTLVDRAGGSGVKETLAGAQRVVAIVLAAKTGRHAAPTQPFAIREGLLRAGLEAPTFVVLAIANASDAAASVSGAARAFPMYSRKSSASAEALRSAAVSVHVATTDGSAVDRDALEHLASSLRLTAALVDAPPCEADVDAFVAVAEHVASEVGHTTVTVVRGEELRDRGFGGLWNVGKAAEKAPALVVLEHRPEGVSEASPSVVLVGKGIVYDTGGLALKPREGMVGMKHDCGGAGGVLGAFRTVALDGGCGKRLVAILCLAENAIGHKAFRNDDVIRLYSGLTVEVNNTDAEGRLVLGDGVAYAAKHLNPSVIIDMATLTGAQGIATGDRHAALYCNDADLEALAIEAGRDSGDLCHGMPYAPEYYAKEFASSIADMKNSVANRSNAQVSCAGQFVGNHLGSFVDTGRWLHIDMAYPAFSGDRATGYGVALLSTLVHRIKVE